MTEAYVVIYKLQRLFWSITEALLMFCSLGYLGKRISIIYNISKLELLFQQQIYLVSFSSSVRDVVFLLWKKNILSVV